MIEQEAIEEVRNRFLGEIEAEIIEMQDYKAELLPGEQINLERESRTGRHRGAIRVENGLCETVGYLPNNLVSWLAPLVDRRKIHLDGYVPQDSRACNSGKMRCPVHLMVFQGEKGHRLLERIEPRNELEVLHLTVLQAYENAQGYRTPELILGLAHGLRPLETQELLPETRLLLALLPRMAQEVRMSLGMRATVKFRELLGTLTLGPPDFRHSLTFFPLVWPHNHVPSYLLLGTALEKGWAKVEEVSKSGRVRHLVVKNKCKRPLLIPKGEILAGAEQNHVIDATVLVPAGSKLLLPVSFIEAGRFRNQSPHCASHFCASPSPRQEKLKPVHENYSNQAVAGGDRGEVCGEDRGWFSESSVHTQVFSLANAFSAAERTARDDHKQLVLPKGASGVLVGRDDHILGIDLFDSHSTLKTRWDRLSDGYFFRALRDPRSAAPTSADHAQRFIERLGSAARPRIPFLALGEELEISGESFVGKALLYKGGICHLAACSVRTGKKHNLERIAE